MPAAAVDFERVVEECRAGGLSEENIKRVAQVVADAFGVRHHEVGILRVEGPWLVFLYPFKLRNVAAIPLNSANSVAALTATNSRPQIINNFAQVRHTTIFESIPLENGPSSGMIQKLVSVPIPGAKGPVGVLQICRKGTTPHKAGADFSFSDLQKLMSKASVLSKLVAA